LEAGYINNSISTIDSDHVGGVGFTQFPIIANVIFSSPIYRGFSAYAGGGLGAIISQWDCGEKTIFIPYGFPLIFHVLGQSATETDCLFGYQAKAGVKYVFSRNWDFSVGYQFLDAVALILRSLNFHILMTLADVPLLVQKEGMRQLTSRRSP
jgi:opacity protein-like surface antigen